MHAGVVAAAAFSLVLAACSSQVQTTSGEAYISGYAVDGSSPEVLRTIDEEIAAAAAVEPQLRFPARLGIARIENGRLSPLPPADSEQWLAMAQRLGDGYGSFVPVSPLVVALAMPAGGDAPASSCGSTANGCLAEIVREVRLGAARQHLDAVLIYETFSRTQQTGNVLDFTKLALIGFFLPTEDIEADGFANAMLVDVRNGYAYGTASAVTGDPSFELSTSPDSRVMAELAGADARTRAVAQLSFETETMMRDLKAALEQPSQ